MILQPEGQSQNQIQSSNKINPGRIEGYDKQRKDDGNQFEIKSGKSKTNSLMLTH